MPAPTSPVEELVIRRAMPAQTSPVEELVIRRAMPASTSPVEELVIRRGQSGNSSSMVSSLGAPTALMVPDLPEQRQHTAPPSPISILKNSSKSGRSRGVRSSSTTRGSGSSGGGGAMVLHGRVVHRAPSSENAIAPGDEAEASRNNTNNRHHSSEKQNQRPTQQQQQQHQQRQSSSSSRLFREQAGTVRERMQRKSMYYGLREDVQKYRQQVQSLEQVLRLFAAMNDASSNSGSRRYKPEPEPSQEEAWRLRILVKSAIDKDKILWDRLYELERSLKEAEEQNDCVKLHRDFKRSHKALVMCLSLIDENRGNHAVLKQLGGVGWARISQPDDGEDDESWEPKQPPKDVTPHEQQKPHVAFEPVEHNALDYEESLTDTKTTRTEERTIDFASLDDLTWSDESDACFNATCLSPPDFICGASFMNCDKSSSREEDSTSERSSHWIMTLKMIQQDMKAIQRSMVRSCRKAQ